MGTICRSCRRVLLFPKGNNVDHLSVYLDVADSVQLPYGWSRFAHFNLAVVNQYDPKSTVKKGLCVCQFSHKWHRIAFKLLLHIFTQWQ